MTRVLSSVFPFVVFCWLSVGAALAAETDAWQVVFTTPRDFAAIDEPVVCILNIQHPDIIRKQLADKPAAEFSGLKLRERVQLASSPECKVEAFKHRQRPVYGTQFHPEVSDDQHPHGRVVLENFFRLAGLGSKPATGG